MMNINQKYRMINIAEETGITVALVFASIMAIMTVGKWIGAVREEILENYDLGMMELSVLFFIANFIAFASSFLGKYLRKHEPEEGYYPLTFTEAYRGAKTGKRYESTSGMILEVGPDGKPMLTKDGSEVSGKTFKLDIAYDVYWRRIREESDED